MSANQLRTQPPLGKSCLDPDPEPLCGALRDSKRPNGYFGDVRVGTIGKPLAGAVSV